MTQSTEERAVWQLEHDYWEYVKAGDLESYSNLWHEDFVGWPHLSERPVRKEHVTGWIVAHMERGEKLRVCEIREAASQFTDNLVVTHYRLTGAWGDDPENTSRITHTWIKTADGWKIIAGMSAPDDDSGR